MSDIAFLFPGQGSQVAGMGRDAAEADKEVMELWKLAEKAAKLALREIYWDGGGQDMARTDALQPAMAAAGLGYFLAVGSRAKAVALAGHSLGEYSALGAAGVLSLADVFELTALRGRLMSEAGAEDDGMAAVVKLEQATVESLVEAAGKATGLEVRVANYNSPAQFVISGKKAALDHAAAGAKEAGGRAIPLAVSGAFHSPLVKEAADEFAKALEKKEFHAPKADVYFNATAKAEPDPAGIRRIMARQMTSSVLWVQTMAAMWEAGVRTFMELGPKNVLTKLCAANLKDAGEGLEAVSVDSLDKALAVGR